MNFYYLLYYKIYVFLQLFNKWLKNDILEWSALFFLSAFEIINVVTLFGILEMDYDIQLNPFYGLEGKFLSLLIIIINYFILIHKGKYKRIVKHFKANYKSNQDFLVLGYVLLTIVIFLVAANNNRERIKEKEMKHWRKEIPRIKN